MSEKKEVKGNDGFGGFSILKGQFKTPEKETEDLIDDIESGDKTIVQEEGNTEPSTEEAKRLAEGDKALKKVIEAKEKLAAKKKGETIIEDTEETKEVEEETESETEESVIKAFTKSLYNKGILDFDDSDEDFEDTEEGIGKLVDKTAQNRINKWVEELPDDYAKFLQFINNGGKPKDFLDIYYGSHSWEGFTIESESNQKVVVAESLRLVDYSEEEINDMVTEWIDNGTLEKRAKTALPKIQKHETTQKENIVKVQKERADKQRKADLDYWNDYKKDLYSKDEVLGFKLTPKVKDKIWNALTVVDRKTGKTGYEQALDSKKDAQILFALQAVNDFDITKLETQVKTKTSKELSNLLRNYNKTTKEKISSGKTDENFESNPFSGFKNSK